MAIARITVVSVADQGDTVIVYGRQAGDPPDEPPIGFVFQAKGADAAPAERASRLIPGSEAVVEYSVVDSGWYLARRLDIPPPGPADLRSVP